MFQFEDGESRMFLTRLPMVYTVKIHNECKGGIDNFGPRIAVWCHEACRVMTNSDHKGRLFIPSSHDYFFLNTMKYRMLCF